jgi:hypothetical protein
MKNVECEVFFGLGISFKNKKKKEKENIPGGGGLNPPGGGGGGGGGVYSLTLTVIAFP